MIWKYLFGCGLQKSKQSIKTNELNSHHVGAAERSMTRVTQKEIAARMGVSISLVSRVLSGTAREIGVPQDTIDEVERMAKKLGYVPNRAAQALKGKSTQTVGVVVYDFKDPFFSDFVGTLQDKLHAKGYSTVLVGFTDRQIDERDLSPLRQHILDAVIILGSDLSGSLHKGIQVAPIFRIGHTVKGEETISYCPDEKRAAEELSDYLESLDCRRVVVLGGPLSNHRFRAAAMERAFLERGLQVDMREVTGKSFFEAGVSFSHELCDAGALPDVIVSTSDQLALGVMKGLLQMGISIPDDIRVTGFDNIRFSNQFYPSLTTFAQPMEELVDRILERIRDCEFQHGVDYFRCPLLKRRSC
jgi:LacI family transcriptional regulator